MLDRHGYRLAIDIKCGIASLGSNEPFLYHFGSMFSMDVNLLKKTMILSSSIIGHVFDKADVFLVTKGRIEYYINYVAEFLVAVLSSLRDFVGKLPQMCNLGVVLREKQCQKQVAGTRILLTRLMVSRRYESFVDVE